MSNNALVSVIIPVHDRAHSIAKAIHSVFAQCIDDIEVIVVDDASNDETVAVVKSIPDPRIKLIRHSINRGAAAARNTGMRHATGRYFAWLDSDDEWLPGKLQEQLIKLNEVSDRNAACCTSFWVIRRGRRYIYRLTQQSDWVRYLLLDCDLASGSTLLFPREVYERIGELDERFTRYEDWDYLLRLAQEFPIVILDIPLARISPSGSASGKGLETSARLFLVKHAGLYEPYDKQLLRRFRARQWIAVASSYRFREHNRAKTFDYLVHTLRQFPHQFPEAIIGLLDHFLRLPLWRVIIEAKYLAKLLLRKAQNRLAILRNDLSL